MLLTVSLNLLQKCHPGSVNLNSYWFCKKRNEDLEGFDKQDWHEFIKSEYMRLQQANLTLIHDLTIILKFWNVLHNFNTKRKRIGFQRKHIGIQFQREHIGPIDIQSFHNLKIILDIFQRDHLNKHIDTDKEYCSPPQLVIQNMFLHDRLNKNIDKYQNKQDYLFDVFQRDQLNKNVDKDKNQSIYQ